MTILYILLGLVGYIVISYVWGALSYKKGCGMDSLAFVLSPLVMPIAIWEKLSNLFRRIF